MLPLILSAALLASAPQSSATPVAGQPGATDAPAWGGWVYLQGDKAVQYRVAKVGQDGDTVLLKAQFRVEPDNTIACYSDSCQGYVVHLAVIDPDSRTLIAAHDLFFPRGTEATWILPETQRFTPKVEDWGRLYLDKDNVPSIAHKETPDEDLHISIFDTSCVDDRIPGVETRCRDYDPSSSIRVGG